MQLWGKTSNGKQRFKCKKCSSTSIRSRADNRLRNYRQLFVRWLTSGTHLVSIAHQYATTVRTLLRRFKPLWEHCPQPLKIETPVYGIVLDGVSITPRERIALIVQNPTTRKPLSWLFTARESVITWGAILVQLAMQGVQPIYAVCDGQKGLSKALLAIWPNIKIQRCLIHVVRQARAWLTNHPQTEAGQKLLPLVKELLQLRTRRQRRRWLRKYRKWVRTYDAFLKERTQNFYSKRRWWYTHRRLRAVRSLITHSLNHLFTFIRYPEIPRTSNHVEGGINSRIKDLLKIHRGLSPQKQQVLVSWYLAIRQGQIPTRNVH